ncbi:YgzB family protein [Halobacillus sp. Marseille-Q1614]|uniref:YgzB family protein n=1 Tax=Halobacillus sp. Marseille-Q1614 TaxID=2709134 RepID=UPI001570540F|nr:YgzB family protein [Halobacillus sp. Marseille-Q1614]
MELQYKSKINKIRSFAFWLIFLGIGVMYIGLLFKETPWAMALFMILGMGFVGLSTVVYFWIGMLSTKTIQIICPTCEKPTKMLGRVDACMHCKQPLTMDKKLEGEEFDEKYNTKRYQKQEAKQRT